MYGPSRFYDVTYHDGDQAECVEDAFVFGSEDYQLEMKGQRWKGVSQVVDKKSSDLWVRFQFAHLSQIDVDLCPNVAQIPSSTVIIIAGKTDGLVLSRHSSQRGEELRSSIGGIAGVRSVCHKKFGG